MISFREYLILKEEVVLSQLKAVETKMDVDFSKFGVRVEFSGHFLERINDFRNSPPIGAEELEQFLTKIRIQYAKKIASMRNNDEGLLKNIKSNLTIAYIIAIDKMTKMNRMVCKTVMRKKVYGNDNFHNDNETLTVK